MDCGFKRHRFLLFPPSVSPAQKLLLVRTGNLRLHQLLVIFRRQMPQIIQAFASHSLVEIDSEQVRLVERG